jgi:hypothetical protein
MHTQEETSENKYEHVWAVSLSTPFPLVIRTMLNFVMKTLKSRQHAQICQHETASIPTLCSQNQVCNSHFTHTQMPYTPVNAVLRFPSMLHNNIALLHVKFHNLHYFIFLFDFFFLTVTQALLQHQNSAVIH